MILLNRPRLLLLAAGAVGSTSIALSGAASAAAVPDVVGRTYADASSAIMAAGLTPVVATRVGARGERGDCVVTSASVVTHIEGSRHANFVYRDTEVLISLNCSG